MSKRLFSLLTASAVIVATAGLSVEAQNKPKVKPTNAPTFVKLENAGKLNLSSAGNPFKPRNFKQSKKPYAGDRGIIGDDNREQPNSRQTHTSDKQL